MRIGIALVVALALVGAGCSDDGEPAAVTTVVTGTATPTSPAVSPATTRSPGTPGPDEPEVPASLQHLDRAVVDVGGMDLLVVVARESTDRERGLMDVADLGGLDGMLFDFGDDTSVDFWMFHVLIPLDIAWFDAEGRFVSAARMVPCVTESAAGDDCERYEASGRYRFALELAAGGLAALGPAPMLDVSALD